jgi:hypothetical protein
MSWLERAGLFLSCYCLVVVIDGSRAESSRGPLGSSTTRDQIKGFLMLAAAESGAPQSETSVFTKSAEKPEPLPAKAPSLIERLEGREGDAMIWFAIAAAFFLVGWISGSIYARRRERSRRTRLRF